MQFKYILKFFESQPIEYILLYNYAPAPRCTTHHYMLPAPQYATTPVSLIYFTETAESVDRISAEYAVFGFYAVEFG